MNVLPPLVIAGLCRDSAYSHFTGDHTKSRILMGQSIAMQSVFCHAHFSLSTSLCADILMA